MLYNISKNEITNPSFNQPNLSLKTATYLEQFTCFNVQLLDQRLAPAMHFPRQFNQAPWSTYSQMSRLLVDSWLLNQCMVNWCLNCRLTFSPCLHSYTFSRSSNEIQGIMHRMPAAEHLVPLNSDIQGVMKTIWYNELKISYSFMITFD